ncbi:6-phosphofructo-2-kinase/fructose-2,6-bisphosphatase 2 [Trichoplax sp. H2]|uniref:6-phosphofructo-2-kinase domain-containing protein n=1 Tax=Trichoplax adhaerens TaxID=10228 RepID=B3RUK6_TRIAD|nr:hypothetical protein TRIADDRAFT_37504 [Trichoplax adhaerens]EDV25833.1 hypothetical protein TRIADDRAFT_37504 [Trichoplax adhaerens]RDD42899.1 6-phosphofructo-2-kinase/fructose-2,6-bisphosphatase 2 [Trichoplax sp. H2]|eukprot:XP_002111866.1 hypothetical protein TRIADDRAFT_37504 [Trichoplax adhaerens]
MRSSQSVNSSISANGYINDEITFLAPCPKLCNVPTVIVMVGLPARGKTFIARKLTHYLNWIGYKTKVFNLGEYRRKNFGATKPPSFYHPDNKEAVASRLKCCALALEDMTEFLKSGSGEVAVFDATNTTRARRKFIYDHCDKNGHKVFFIESCLENPEIEMQNITEVKVGCPDYKDMNAEDAIKDFKARIENYRLAYQPLSVDYDRKLSFIKIMNVGEQYQINKVEGFVQSKSVYYLMNMNIIPRTIYLVRHGETEYNQENRIGGDPQLSDRGVQFAEKLAEFMSGENIPELKVWTSQLRRTVQSAEYVSAAVSNVVTEKWKALNEIDAGICDELTYNEIKEKFPEEYKARSESKFYYRYPRGESYEDLVNRLEPVIMELERKRDILVICHQGVMRCLLAYFLDHELTALPWLEVPLHTVFKLSPTAYGCKEEKFTFGVDAVSTHHIPSIESSENLQTDLD